ncbi:hypothetical protein [Psychrobacter coccoides]|uniref:hypothetical protein n=1 Tax=Psychrobacter coccoides TaxID=2818440 RepID=UPI001FB0E5A5|nr:hypothetical protein [Psychrobacter coccoides]
MLNQSETLIGVLHELGLTPLDWVDAQQFSALTGIEEKKLPARKRRWPENVVWMKQSGNIYYSIRGYNKWMTSQAKEKCRQASGSDMAACKSTSVATKRRTTSRSHTPQLQRASIQPLKLDVN